jgi:hypothetical protein
MKRAIKCIYIDGMEKSGKTSVTREVRKYLKNKNKDLYEIPNTDLSNLNKQSCILKENVNCVILKQNSILSVLYDRLKSNVLNWPSNDSEFNELLRVEKEINHIYGSVLFFLVPENCGFMKNRFEEKEVPGYFKDLLPVFSSITSYSLVQGLTIEIITYNENDFIFDVVEKITKVIEEKYRL